MLPEALNHGSLHRFADWPNDAVPQVAAGVYTIWRGDALLYVGMAGRSLTSDDVARHRSESASGKGLFSRLNSHACGRRSGDQFCVYVADRLVLPTLAPHQIEAIGRGELAMDGLTRTYIREHLTYRFAEARGGAEAREWEATIRRGALSAGAPLLNPLARASSRAAAT
jgi:hypothetical protein